MHPDTLCSQSTPSSSHLVIIACHPHLIFASPRVCKSHTDTHLLILVPQISSILRFFIYKNLRIARSRAYALTVSSRGKPREFWSQVSVTIRCSVLSLMDPDTGVYRRMGRSTPPISRRRPPQRRSPTTRGSMGQLDPLVAYTTSDPSL